MKTSDYVTVGFIAIFVTAIAYFLVNSLLGDPTKLSIKFDYLNETSSELAKLPDPDQEIFNKAAINPTVEVYIGSCEDQNLDGKLDDKERKDCGLDAYETTDGTTTNDYLEENGGLSNSENDAINSSQDYAKGTTADQRQQVENDVNQYQQQTQSNSSQQDNAARQETVSGS